MNILARYSLETPSKWLHAQIKLQMVDFLNFEIPLLHQAPSSTHLHQTQQPDSVVSSLEMINYLVIINHPIMPETEKSLHSGVFLISAYDLCMCVRPIYDFMVSGLLFGG